MSKENILLVIWIIFGFIFVSAIDSVLHFITYLIYFASSELRIPYKILTFAIPIITLVLYVSTTFILIKRIKTKSNSVGIYLTKFPKKSLILLAFIAILLKPITHKLSGLYTGHSMCFEEFDTMDYIQVYGWMTMGIGVSRWIVLILLIIIFINKLNNIKNKLSTTPCITNCWSCVYSENPLGFS